MPNGHQPTSPFAQSANIFEQGQDDTFNLDAWATGAKDDGSAASETKHSRDGSHVPQHSPSYSEDHPAWADMKTKAGKDRKRLPLACIACRRKKIKCSGEKPSCQHCVKSRIPCVYKVTQRRATPRTDYMAMLDKRLKRMEDRIVKGLPKEDIDKIPRAVVKPSTAVTQRSAPHGRKRDAEQAFGEDLDRWASDPVERRKSHQVTIPQTDKAEETSSSDDAAEALPPLAIQEHLAEVYFDYIYGQSYFILHKGRFMASLRAGTVPPYLSLAVCAVSARFSSWPDKSYAELHSEPAFLRGERWAKAAQDVAMRRFDQPNVTTVTVLLLLSLHGFGCCQGGRSWMMSGMAHRMVYALRLHKDPPNDGMGLDKGNTLSFTDRELRRRVMWATFQMDRFTSSGTERPMFASERYLSLQLPVREELFRMEIPAVTEHIEESATFPPLPEGQDYGLPNPDNPKANMGVAAYVIRSIGIWGKLVQYMNLGGRTIDEQYPIWSTRSQWHGLMVLLKTFHGGLPERLRYTPENIRTMASENLANALVLLHIVYNQCVLFLHRFAYPAIALYTPCKGEPQAFMDNARKKAQEAANNISGMIEDAIRYRVVFPFAGYSAYTSSAVHLYGAFSSDPALEKTSKENLTRNIKYLSKMKKHWGMFHFLTENLKDLYRQHADAAKRGVTLGSERRGVYQYADWHERYPRGVSSTDHEEPLPGKGAGKSIEGGHTQQEMMSVEEYVEKSAKTPSLDSRQPQQQGSRGRLKGKSGRRPGATASRTSDPTNNLHSRAGGDMTNTEVTSPAFENQESYNQLQPSGSMSMPANVAAQSPMELDGQSQFAGPGMSAAMYSQASPVGASPFAAENNPEVAMPMGSDPLLDLDWNAIGNEFLVTEPSNAYNMAFNINVPGLGDGIVDGTDPFMSDFQGAWSGFYAPSPHGRTSSMHSNGSGV